MFTATDNNLIEREAVFENLTNADISKMRAALDTTSWTPFKEPAEDKISNVVRVDFTNRYLIEGFDWFILKGIKEILDNYEFQISPTVIVKLTDHRVEPPTRMMLNKDRSNEPLFPNEARLAKINYSGDLIVTLNIMTINEQTLEQRIEVVENVPFGKIPIMVGSKFCNLMRKDLVGTVERLRQLGGDPDDPLGFYIINGNPIHLISQNYLKVNRVICIMSKMSIKAASGNLLLVADLRSRAHSGKMVRQRIFIMSHAKNKLSSGDRRIYCQLGSTIRKNSYDSTQTTVGINVVSVYRMAHVLKIIMNPFKSKREYLFSDSILDGVQVPGGHFMTSTFLPAGQEFLNGLHKYGGEKLYDMVLAYRENTLNEASLEENESNFWRRIKDVTVQDSEKNKQSTPIRDHSMNTLKQFGSHFMPHISHVMFDVIQRQLYHLSLVIRREIVNQIKTTAIQKNSDTIRMTDIADTENDIEFAMMYLSARFKGTNPELDAARAEKINRWGLEGYIQNSETANAAARLYNKFADEMTKKIDMFSYMIVKILRVEMDIDVLDDRDSIANQMYEHPGIMMQSRFAVMMRGVRDYVKGKSSTAGQMKTIFSTVGESIVEKEFADNFARGEWNKPDAVIKRNGVTGTMPSASLVGKLGALRQLSSNAPVQSKILDSREITGLHFGFICPSDTPEGKQCGKLTRLAAAAIITSESYDDVTWGMKLAQKLTNKRRDPNVPHPSKTAFDLAAKFARETTRVSSLDQLSEEEKLLYPISSQSNGDRTCPLFLNGIPVGWVNGLKFRRTLIGYRRQGIMHPFTGIHYRSMVSNVGMILSLTIDTTGGRVIQPLIIAEDPERTFSMLWGLYLRSQRSEEEIANDPDNVAKMFSEGFIEFVDPAEMEFLDLAPSATAYLKSIQIGQPHRYDHIMLNPAFLMGITANLQPFANMNTPVRNSYFTSMVKQPATAADLSLVMKADTAVAQLLTVQKPIVTTDVYDAVYGKEYFGKNLNILIAPHMDGEEDGIVVRQSFVENRGLASHKFSAYHLVMDSKSKLEFGEQFFERRNDPDRYGKGVIRVKRKVPKLDPETGEEMVDPETGEVIMEDKPVIVQPGDILAREMKSIRDKLVFNNLVFESLRDGEVDRIMWEDSAGQKKIVYVIIKLPDTLWYGDKLANRHSQKGVIVKVVPDDEMYRDEETGEIPDIIVNPQALPSRMTVGMMAEMVVANAHIWPDKNRSVPILYNEKGFDIYAPLERLFIVSKQELNEVHDGLEDHEKLSPIKFPTNSRIPNSPIMQTTSGLRSQNPEIETQVELISSEAVFNMDQLNYLKERDLGEKWGPEGNKGIYAIRIYGTPIETQDLYTTGGTGELEIKDIAPSGDIRYAIILIDDSLNAITTLPLNDPRIQPIYNISPQFRARIVYVLGTPSRLVEDIEGMYADPHKGIGGARNNARGIRVSNLPETPLSMQENTMVHLGNNIREVYIHGNPYTPVANQCIIAYRSGFFTRKNIESYYMDYIIPDNMLEIKNVKLPLEDGYRDVTLPKGITRLSALKKDRKKIKAFETQAPKEGEDPNAPLIEVEIETTLYEMWMRSYPYTKNNNHDYVTIERKFVVDLPVTPRGIFDIRHQKIENLRHATAFKDNMDLYDARHEMEMMGYTYDMKRTFRKGKNGPLVRGGLVSGYNYYKAMPQKVLDKVQARGDDGRYDIRNGQPNRGRVNGGGIRFNNADALAVRRTGANGVVADRLLHASGRTDIYVCQKCDGNVCHQIGPGVKDSGTIICPKCIDPRVVRIQVPYAFLYMRNLMMGAGIHYKIQTKLLKQQLDEDAEM
tara:strand:- start:65645 stop:71074 length:5430 start_codon:yes stop_codon:yes gene_type:complete